MRDVCATRDRGPAVADSSYDDPDGYQAGQHKQELDGAPSMANEWREHPKLVGRFHPDFPDDVQVIVHEGGPRFSDRQPELVWVRTTAYSANVFTGLVLNQPSQLTRVSKGSEIRFVVPDGGEHPLMVTEKYLAERSDWTIEPCDKCGLSELFDAPSDLVRVIFPATPEDAAMEMFTTFCGFCGGVLVVQREDASAE